MDYKLTMINNPRRLILLARCHHITLTYFCKELKEKIVGYLQTISMLNRESQLLPICAMIYRNNLKNKNPAGLRRNMVSDKP